jgi:hypothetical protein
MYMSLLKSIGRIFPTYPFVVTMSIVAGGVRTAISRANAPVNSSEFFTAKGLPEAVVQYLRTQAELEPGLYCIPFPAAKRLIKELQEPVLNKTVKLETAAVEAFKPVAVPADFRVQWHFDSKRHVLIRHLIKADGYLGAGCFYAGTQIWRLNDKLSIDMLAWLGKAEIAGNELTTFILYGLNAHSFPYLECNLRIETGFSAELKIIKLLKQSIDVQIVSNRPDLQKGVTAIKGNSVDLLSGNIILPEWGKRLHGLLLDLANSGEVTRFSGINLAEFIFDHGVNFAALGVSELELSHIHDGYSVHDGTALPLTWQLTHHLIQGIGRYWATPCLNTGNTPIPLEVIGSKLESGARFHATDTGWIAFTPAFRQRFSEWQAKNVRPISLLPQEILGTHLERLTKMRLTPPEVDVNTAGTESDQAILFFEGMRRHGLPAGVTGLQNEMGQLLAQVCKRLLQDQKNARILWIMPRRRRDSAIETLRRADVSIAETPNNLDGRVTILSPEVIPPANINWTLIIFSELDLIASGDAQIRAYAVLPRLWAICTFSRPSWAENKAHAGRFIRALGLGENDLLVFQRICTRAFSEQTDGLIKRLTSPFKKMILGEDTPSGTGAVPIPAPPQTSVRATTEVFRPTFDQTPGSSSAEESFLVAAQRYAQHTERVAEPTLFMQYFPTYKAMNAAQKRWYFYWRSEVRKNNFLQADLSYIFLHVYEVIHLVGFANAPSAFNHLTTLWREYRQTHPRLDRYLIDWLADFLVVYKLPRTPLEWYARAFEMGDAALETNLAIEAWLTTGGNLDHIPDVLLDQLCDYSYRKSKFYTTHNADGNLDKTYREALQRIDAYIHEREGKSLFESFRPTNVTAIQRQPFAGAIYEGARQEITIASLPNWEQADALHENITAIIKHTENLLRRQKSFKGTLRDIALSPEWAGILDAEFPAPNSTAKPPRKKRQTSAAKPETELSVASAEQSPSELVLDFNLLDDLLASRVRTQELLSVEESDTTLVQNTDHASMVSNSTITFDTERPVDTPAHLLTDLREVADVIAGDPRAVAVLRVLYDERWKATENHIQHSVEDEFLTGIIYRINERACQLLGDNLVFVDNGIVTVAEDYQDELTHLLTHIVETGDSAEPILDTMSEIQAEAAPDLAYDDLALEWADFARRMKAEHWEALNVLLQGQDVAVRLDGVARSANTMVSLIINDINDIALSCIGDIVINSAVEPPAIEEEDMDDLHALNTWVLQHHVQEL